MKQPSTCQMVLALLSRDPDVRCDQRDAVRVVLSEKSSPGAPAIQPLLLTQSQVAQMLNVSRITVYRLVKEKVIIPTIIQGMHRYRREDIERLAREGYGTVTVRDRRSKSKKEQEKGEAKQ